MAGFTQEQYNYARYEASALDYARSRGYDLVERGRYYVLRDHDSMVFTDDGRWFWNSQGLSGRAIEFVMNYENKPLNEAVLDISGENALNAAVKRSDAPRKPKGEFVLPEKARNNKRLVYYLCQVRGISEEIVRRLLKEHRIYQSSRGNVVFVGFDEYGNPKNAFERGTWENNPYKHQTPYSEKQYPFKILAESKSDTAAIFESCIDAMSYASLRNIAGMSFEDTHLISIGGQNDVRPILYFLEQYPNVKKLYFCLDNDEAGKNGTAKLTETLRKYGYTESNGYRLYMQLPKAKDWNDDLLNYRAEVSEIYKRMAAFTKDAEKETVQTEERE